MWISGILETRNRISAVSEFLDMDTFRRFDSRKAFGANEQRGKFRWVVSLSRNRHDQSAIRMKAFQVRRSISFFSVRCSALHVPGGCIHWNNQCRILDPEYRFYFPSPRNFASVTSSCEPRRSPSIATILPEPSTSSGRGIAATSKALVSSLSSVTNVCSHGIFHLS
jgi:hypothetical protein